MERKKLLKLSGTILLVLVLVALALGGCAKPVEETKPINIGCSIDCSGKLALIGIAAATVYEAVLNEVNEAGGINGRPLKFFLLDDGCDPTRAVGNLKRLMELNNCVAMIIGHSSTISLADKTWADENHIPIISATSMSEALWVKEGKAWYFRAFCPSSVMLAAGLARAKELGYTKIGYEGTTQAWGTSSLESLKQIAPDFGVEIVGHVLGEPKSKDMTIQAMELRDTGAEAVLQCEYTAEIGVWARALKDIDWDVQMINQSGGGFGQALATYPAELFEGWNFAYASNPANPKVQEVWKLYEEVTGKYWEDPDMPMAWDAINALVEAIKLSGNPDDPEAIRDGFYKIKDLPLACGRPGTLGSFEIGRNHMLRVEDLAVMVIKSGKMVTVE